MKSNESSFGVKNLLRAGAFTLVMGVGAASAQTVVGSDTMQVTANVVGQCSITANDLNFGSYDQNSAVDVDASSNIAVVCPDGDNFDLGLDGGLGAGGAFAGRSMSGGTPGGTVLEYDLFQDAARTTVWGDTPPTDTQAGVGQPGNAPVNFTVFGQIPAGQSPNPGAYADTVTAIVFF